ncbi:MAG: GerMN domain-containing protein [Prochloraceae cyanobacterium]
MQKQQPGRRFSLGLITGVSVVVLAVGGGTAWWAINSTFSSEEPQELPKIVASPKTIKPPVAANFSSEQTGQVYWLKITKREIELVPSSVTIEQSSGDREIIESALNRLLTGPKDGNYTTTIPQGTKLLGLNVEGSEIRLNLSQEFTTGGGSASMIARLGQILYTASSLDPQSKVWIEVEGKPLEALGGEGITITQPMTRKIFEEDFPLSGYNQDSI